MRTQFSIHPLDLQRIIQPDVYNVKTVAIAQYPDGKSKWLSLARIYEIQEKHILYDASTVACCSGSPVFYACNEHCYLIALHKSVCGKTSVNKGMFINHIFDHLYGGKLKEFTCSSGFIILYFSVVLYIEVMHIIIALGLGFKLCSIIGALDSKNYVTAIYRRLPANPLLL